MVLLHQGSERGTDVSLESDVRDRYESSCAIQLDDSPAGGEDEGAWRVKGDGSSAICERGRAIGSEHLVARPRYVQRHRVFWLAYGAETNHQAAGRQAACHGAVTVVEGCRLPAVDDDFHVHRKRARLAGQEV